MTTTTRPAAPPGRPAPVHAGNFELFSWFFMRISGLFLVFLAVGHMFIMHVINDVKEVDYAFVAARWETPFWRTWDWLLLALALLHGVNGLRIVLDDYVRSPGRRLAAKWSLYTLSFVFFFLGTLVIVTFRSEA